MKAIWNNKVSASSPYPCQHMYLEVTDRWTNRQIEQFLCTPFNFRWQGITRRLLSKQASVYRCMLYPPKETNQNRCSTSKYFWKVLVLNTFLKNVLLLVLILMDIKSTSTCTNYFFCTKTQPWPNYLSWGLEGDKA